MTAIPDTNAPSAAYMRIREHLDESLSEYADPSFFETLLHHVGDMVDELIGETDEDEQTMIAILISFSQAVKASERCASIYREQFWRDARA